MFRGLANSSLAFSVRRFPFEALRWRAIPTALRFCERTCRARTVRRIRTRHGFQMQVDVSDWLGRHVYVTGEYESSTTSILKSILQQGDAFLDVGAHVGYFTLLAARLVGASGRVFSFEPTPHVFSNLEMNVRLNGYLNCTLHNLAASNCEGQCSFYPGPQHHSSVLSLSCTSATAEMISVRTMRIDDVLPGDATIRAAKIDVEGAECHVLEGMEKLLERCRPDLFVEVTPDFLARMQRTSDDLESRLLPLGYSMFEICQSGLQRLDTLSQVAESQFNALFTTQPVGGS